MYTGRELVPETALVSTWGRQPYTTIARDATSVFNYGGSPSWSHTCSGTNRVLVVYVRDDGNTLTGITYAGVSLTLLTSRIMAGGYLYGIWGLSNPTLGTNTITISGTGSVGAAAASYTDATFLGPLVANSTAAGNGSTSVTTPADGYWGVCGYGDRTGTAPVAGSNSTVIATPGAGASMALFDTGMAKLNGSLTMAATGGNPTDGVMVGLRPFRL